RRLVQTGGNAADDEMAVGFTAHSQASSPRLVASPQLPSPGVCFYDVSIENPSEKYRNSTQGTFTPLTHARAGRTGAPERRSPANRKLRISRRRPATFDVMRQTTVCTPLGVVAHRNAQAKFVH
ncbi:MAG: hypothetical protein RJS97_00750, partial [Parvibaculaceae bacterium]